MPAPALALPAILGGLKSLGWAGGLNALMGVANVVGTGLYLKDSLGGLSGSMGEGEESSMTEEAQMEELLRERQRERRWRTGTELRTLRQQQGLHHGL